MAGAGTVSRHSLYVAMKAGRKEQGPGPHRQGTPALALEASRDLPEELRAKLNHSNPAKL